MREKNKRNRLFNYFRKNMSGIVLIQETYSVPGDLATWSKEWGGHVVISSGTSHSKGVAILLPKNMEYNIDKCEIDEKGRYILMVGTFHKHEMAILNI